MTPNAERPRLAVLMYHGVVSRPLDVADWCFIAEAEFRQQMEFLARNTRVVPLAQGARELEDDTNACSVAVTFDDGLNCVHDVAFPILRDLGIPATLFLATDFVGTDRRLWFCEVNRALASTPLQSLTWNGETHDLTTASARARANASIQAQLKRHPHPALLEHLEELISILRPDDDRSNPANDAFGIVDESQIDEMLESGLIELGAHTGSHAILSLLGDQQVSEEIGRSVARTSELAGIGCRLFAYPNGRHEDYTEHAIDELRSLGIELAVTTHEAPNGRGQPPLELNRLGIGADTTFEQFESLLEPCLQAG